jgi:hypothetical protein
MCFDPWNCSLKIWKSIGTPTPKMGAHLGMWKFIPSHSPTLPKAWNVTPMLHSWPAPSQARALVTSLRLKLQHFWKAPLTCALLPTPRNFIMFQYKFSSKMYCTWHFITIIGHVLRLYNCQLWYYQDPLTIRAIYAIEVTWYNLIRNSFNSCAHTKNIIQRLIRHWITKEILRWDWVEGNKYY